jgi:hypothetical protein
MVSRQGKKENNAEDNTAESDNETGSDAVHLCGIVQKIADLFNYMARQIRYIFIEINSEGLDRYDPY